MAEENLLCMCVCLCDCAVNVQKSKDSFLSVVYGMAEIGLMLTDTTGQQLPANSDVRCTQLTYDPFGRIC